MGWIILLLVPSLSEGNWVPFVPGIRQALKPDVVATTYSEYSVDIDVETYGIEWKIKETDFMENSIGEEFALLSFRHYAYTGEIGKPKLPMVTGVIEIPYGSQLRLEIKDTEYEEVPLKSLGIDKRIIPAFASVPKIKGAVGTFILDKDIYSRDTYYPDKIASIHIHEGTARGHRLATIEFYPLQYNPVTGMIRYYKSIQARIDFIGGDLEGTKKKINENYSRDWEEFIDRMVLNPDVFESKGVAPLPIYYDIFYSSDFSEAAESLAYWKKKKGFKIRMWDATGWTASQIDDTIDAQTPLATYLVLIADPDASNPLPASGTGSSSGDQTDLYYAETD
ncbi:MAG: C25 family peptidase propeptide domain-containing protein, partial [candidate division WOR-3 bacterium]|nr:C25 family peptidase propeptide domain-containing protein [candidate division WOR-3 bacterium]